MAQEAPIDRFLLEISLDGTIMLATPRAASVIGYGMHELKSRSIFDLASPDSAGDLRQSLLGIMESRRPFERLEAKLLAKNGDLLYVELSGVFLHIHGETMYQITVRNVSDRVRAEIERNKAREEAELYLDLITHDIANLNQIGMGYLELAIDTTHMDQRDRELLEKPLEVFVSTSRLIGNIKKLRAARMGGGVTTERISLARLVESLRDEFPTVPGREISINYHVACDCEVMANGLIREVFVNLIGNAIKHSSPEKPLRVDVLVGCVRQQDRKYCLVVVEDNGSGITDAQKQNLMMRMTGGGGSRGRGIGLILTRTLVDDFKGEIQVEDRVPGDYRQGVRIVVLLPAAPMHGDIDDKR